MLRCLMSVLLLCCLGSCATPRIQHVADVTHSAVLTPAAAIMPDGYRLPVAAWQPPAEPRAIVLALHGFNDYRNAFAGVGRFLAGHGITTYAYDQRGFGETTQRGIWPGSDTLQNDAVTMLHLVCRAHPGLPVYLFGESMGGAVLMSLLQEAPPPCLAGVVLIAPAVWGWQTMPLLQQAALWLAVHTFPDQTLTARGLDITPSDNVEMLRALGRDPLVIKETRIDTLFGLTNLMEAAFLAGVPASPPVLLLYGEHDEIIPADALCAVLGNGRLPTGWRMVLYSEGYHMLTRDLQAAIVLRDVMAWINDRNGELPSGLEVRLTTARLQRFCGSLHEH
jgi:alpha-beta hydrolase superfamily lysophospholipase